MPDPSPPDGADRLRGWIDGARAGSADCLGYIADTYRSYLLLIANQELDAQLQRKVGASDVVQETLMQAQLKFEQFRGQGEEELIGWLRQILRNQLIDAARRFKDAEKRQVSRERALGPRDDSQGAGVPLAGSDRSPRAEMILQEESEALKQALERLPEDYRRVIVLRNWERLPLAEVGEKMDRSAAAAGKLWTRAVERLQQELEGLADSRET